MPPKLQFIHRIQVDEMKVQKMRPNERLDSTSTRSGERLDLTGEVTVSFFNELDTRKELCSGLQVQSHISISFF
jgi:hypothetical protein